MLLAYYTGQPGSQPVFEVVVSGVRRRPGTTRSRCSASRTASASRIADPLGNLEVDDAKVAEETRPQLTLAAGLALGAFA